MKESQDNKGLRASYGIINLIFCYILSIPPCDSWIGVWTSPLGILHSLHCFIANFLAYASSWLETRLLKHKGIEGRYARYFPP